MRIAILTARPRCAASPAVAYLASDIGAANVLVVRLPEIDSPVRPLRRVVRRRIRRWADKQGSAVAPVEEVARLRGVTVVHVSGLGSSVIDAVHAHQTDLAVGMGLGGHSVPGPHLGINAIELRYGGGHEEDPEAAVLWAIHRNAVAAELVFRRLPPGPGSDVVYQEPVAIPYQATLPQTVHRSVEVLEERAARALAEFAPWSDELIERAVPAAGTDRGGVPSFRELRAIKDRHTGLRRKHLAAPATPGMGQKT